MTAFDTSFASVVNVEGGFQNDPGDSGNWTGGRIGVGTNQGTKYGISAASFPTVNIAALTLDQAKAIYKAGYWDPLQLDQLDAGLAFQCFDASVNCGVVTAAKWMQRAAGVGQDGIIGAQSIGALRTADPWRMACRVDAYRLLSNAQAGAWATYGKGWTNRLANNLLALAA
jgi:lysozyme family protein